MYCQKNAMVSTVVKMWLDQTALQVSSCLEVILVSNSPALGFLRQQLNKFRQTNC